MNTLTMMTCRLLYALLVLALCCCPSVCTTGSGQEENTTTTTTTKPPTTTTTTTTKPPTTTTTTTTKPPTTTTPRPLRQRHQALRLQRRQIRRPPVRRQVFAELTAASAALRGRVPRCFSPHPRWRTPLWAEEVCAGCACEHSATGTCVLLPWSDV
ncbi:mucin TcMUCII [Trypanosoma cruzi cruzi]|nr:mucin TcMUCII [Trypanosoma cruzi cruzi]